MFRNVFLFLALFSANFAFASEEATPSSSQRNIDTTEINRISEAFGHLIGSNLKNPGITFNVESLIEGIRNAQEGKPSPMSAEEYEEAMSSIQEIAFNEMADENLRQADSFMASNKTQRGIVEVSEGKVQYEVLKKGNGDTVSEESTPVIQYTGSYLDGTVFGSSESTGGPITLPLNQTISGFSKALVGMREGEKRKIFIHPDEGYGKFGHLEPNALLMFEVEVIKSDAGESPLSTEGFTANGETQTDDASMR